MASEIKDSRPVCWTIAGSDCSGGAGIQADIKTMNALGVHACSVITALTAQNSNKVMGWQSVSLDMLQKQIDALIPDFSPQGVKIGMLGSPQVGKALMPYLDILKSRQCKIVWDPVLTASTGDVLWNCGQTSHFENIFSFLDLVTPNIFEAQAFWGRQVKTSEDVEQAAQYFMDLGVRSVLVKGGHLNGIYCSDFWTNGKEKFWLTSPRQKESDFHGTGCTLSSAIAAYVALGFEISDALVVAKAYVNQAIRNTSFGCTPFDGSNGLLVHESWSESPQDMPWLTHTAEESVQKYTFKNCGPRPLGFYPIVNRATWVESLLALGVTTIQLRIKDLRGFDLENEISSSVEIAQKYNGRLFINDYWDLALKHGAYGVHLGQEDLVGADCRALEKNDIRLGISTHSYAEMARALALRPSYMAVGPIYPTTCKSMRFGPQGLDRLRRFRKSLSGPVVAIGGISLDLASEVLATGVDGIAVISDVVNAPDLEDRVKQWLQLFGHKT